MVVPPYPLSGLVYDTNGTSLALGAKVTCRNVTKDEWLPEVTTVITDLSGEYVIDLANLPTDYENGDKIQIVAFDSTGLKSIDFRHTVNTVVGAYENNAVLHPGESFTSSSRICAVVVANTTAGGLRVDFYDRTNDIIRLSIEVPAADTRSARFGSGNDGLFFEGGICKILESETAGELIVTIKSDSNDESIN